MEAVEDNMEDEDYGDDGDSVEIVDELVDEPVHEPVNRKGDSKHVKGRTQDLPVPKEYTRQLIPYIFMMKDIMGNIMHIVFEEDCDIADVLEEEGNFTITKSDKALADFSSSVPGIIVTHGIWTRQVMCLKKLIDIKYPFCVMFPLGSLGKKGVSKQLKRCDNLTIIVLNNKYDFVTKSGESFDVDEFCGNFPEGYFEKSLYFAFTDEDDDLVEAEDTPPFMMRKL